MDGQLRDFLSSRSFPCIMAKAALKRGEVHYHQVREQSVSSLLSEIDTFVANYRENPEKLHSLIFGFPKMSFDEFEDVFWRTLIELKRQDPSEDDPRVSSDPFSPRFSYSLFSEAFFLILLHPDSPRFARRLPFPAIVMNPHRQFEDLRSKRIFFKVRNIIRRKDRELQGMENVMLDDFGHSSEIYQYTGKTYDGPDEYIQEFYANYFSSQRSGLSTSEGLAVTGDGY